jgi:hypothetical protein
MEDTETLDVAKNSHSKSPAHKEELVDFLPLLRILVKEPPKDHDCKTCPICKEYGITQI